MQISTQKSFTIFKLWSKIPVIIRSVVLGFIILVVGQIFTIPLIQLNVKYYPNYPWSVFFMVIYLWIFWQYIGGRWWPLAISQARKQLLRANRISVRTWKWSLIAGVSFLSFVASTNYAISYFHNPGYSIPSQLLLLPKSSLLVILIMVSIIAGTVEESAFRGYMQGPMEKRHGSFIAVVIIGIVFLFSHFTNDGAGMPAVRILFIILASVFYSTIASYTNSILPAIIIHTVGDIISFTLLWLKLFHPGKEEIVRGLSTAIRSEMFWIFIAVAIVSIIACIFSLRKLHFFRK